MSTTRDNHPITYIGSPGEIIYRASAIGGCVRSLVASRLGFTPLPPPEQLQLLFQRGIDAEDRIIYKLNQIGYEVYDREKEINLYIPNSGVTIRGHIDGIIKSHQFSDTLLEMKTMSDQVFDRWVPNQFTLFQRYAYQISAYSHALNIPKIMFAILTPDDELHIYHYTEPPIELSSFKRRTVLVETSARLNDLLPCDITDYPCPYYFLHEDDRLEVESPAIRDMVSKYNNYTEDIRTLQREKDKVRDDLISNLTLYAESKESNAKKFAVGSDSVSIITRESVQLNYEAIEKAGIDISKFQSRKSGTPYIQVKKGKSGANPKT